MPVDPHWVAVTATPVTPVREVITGPTALDLHAGRTPAAPYHLALGSKTRHINRVDMIAHRTRQLTAEDVTVIHGMSVTTTSATVELDCGTLAPEHFNGFVHHRVSSAAARDGR